MAKDSETNQKLSQTTSEETQINTDQTIMTGERPERTSPKWSEYVLSLFEPDELYDGSPTTDGLRRVAQIVNGPITESISTVVQAPNIQNDGYATVQHLVEFLIEKKGKEYYARYCDVADTNPLNTDPIFARFASATAATKAEGRALRKACGLARVLAAEEKGPEYDKNRLCVPSQLDQLEMMCKRNNVNRDKFVRNMNKNNKTKFKKMEEIPYELMANWLRNLNDIEKGRLECPNECVGYQGE